MSNKLEDMEKVYSEEANGHEHLKYFESEDGKKKHVEYAFSESQQEVWESWVSAEHQIVDFRAGYGSGKSVCGARVLIRSAWEISNSRWLCMAESFSEGWETTYRILLEQLPACDADNPEESPIVEEYRNHEKKYLKFTNGSKIILGSAEKSDRHKGDEYAGIWCDEVALYNIDLYNLMDMLLSRLRSSKPPLTCLWTTTTNPKNPHNDYYYISEIGEYQGQEIHWDIKTVKANTLNNPFISEDAKEMLRKTHEGNESQGLKGDFADPSGQVFSKFNRTDNVIDEVYELDKEAEDPEYDEDKVYIDPNWRAYGYDAGWDDARVILEVGRTQYNQLVVLDEFYQHESMVDEAVNWLKRKPSGVIYSEHEKEHMARFRRNLSGFRPELAEKGQQFGIEEVQERFGVDHTGRVGLFIHSRCTNTLREIDNYNEVGGANDDHAMDSLRYVVATLADRVTRQREAQKGSTGGKRSSVRTSKGKRRNLNESRKRARDRIRGRRNNGPDPMDEGLDN